MPFENISGDPDQEYFVDGVTDDITTALSKLNWLFVISRDTTFTYKDRAVDIKRVGQELGVRYVLAGSLRKAGDRLRLNVRLMDAATGTQVWADRYDGLLESVFDLQDEITASVVSTLAPEITSAEIERARKKRPESLDAWDYYLRSLPFSFEVTREGFEEATRLLEASIGLDPKFSTAYARLAVNHFYATFQGWIGGARTTAEKGQSYARRAVELDPLNPLAHEAMGAAHIFSDRKQTISSSQRALSLDPNLSVAFGALSNALAFTGRADEAIEAFKRAERCSPRDPMRWFRLCGLFNAYFKLEDYEAAVEVCREVSQIKPMWYGGYAIEAASCGLLGWRSEAERAVSGLLNASPRFSVEGAARNQLWDEKDGAGRVIEGLRKAGLREHLH